MTQDPNDSRRPLFADIDDRDDELKTGTTPTTEPGNTAGVAPMSVGQSGAGAIPLGPPTRATDPLNDTDHGEPPQS